MAATTVSFKLFPFLSTEWLLCFAQNGDEGRNEEERRKNPIIGMFASYIIGWSSLIYLHVDYDSQKTTMIPNICNVYFLNAN